MHGRWVSVAVQNLSGLPAVPVPGVTGGRGR